MENDARPSSPVAMPLLVICVAYVILVAGAILAGWLASTLWWSVVGVSLTAISQVIILRAKRKRP